MTLAVQHPLAMKLRSLNDATTQLSTGWCIHFSANDAAGSAINSKLVTQARSLNMNVRNKDISMMQTADSAVDG